MVVVGLEYIVCIWVWSWSVWGSKCQFSEIALVYLRLFSPARVSDGVAFLLFLACAMVWRFRIAKNEFD
jgi:hypothetical protein